MKPLNQQQFEQIRHDIARANLTISSLNEELIDHVCCQVEELMSEGLSFEAAYHEIKRDSRIEVLKQIEEDTFLLINKNYLIMKTTMKLSGILSLSAIAIGTIMRFIHLSGANILLVLGFALLTLVFLPASAFLDYSISKEKFLLRRLSLLAGSILLCSGVLFKVMHWNGANLFILTGSFSMLILFLPQLFVGTGIKQLSKQERSIYLLGMLSIFVFALGLLFKMLHWPGAKVLFVSGSALLLGLFIPIYSLKILSNKQQMTGRFIYLIILSIYLITMTGLISVSSQRDSANQTIQQPN